MNLRTFAGGWLLVALPVVAASAQTTWPGRAWPTAEPAAVGMDAAALAGFDAEIAGGKYGLVDGLNVIRRGRAVLDRSYRHNYDSIYGPDARRRSALNPHDPGGPYNYYNPWWHPFYRRGELHSLQSVTKTVTSVIIGAAIARGEFPSLDAPVLPFFEAESVDPARWAVPFSARCHRPNPCRGARASPRRAPPLRAAPAERAHAP